MRAKKLLNLLEVQSVRGEGRSVYDKAVSLGFPYIRGEGKPGPGKDVWMTRFTKTSDGSGPAIYVGWNAEAKKFEVEEE